MRIAVYCSASTSIDQKYLDLAFDVGVAIANSGADLVWGGGQVSMMGAAARGARERGHRFEERRGCDRPAAGNSEAAADAVPE